VTEEAIERFASYSTEDLARLLFELEKSDDARLERLIAEVRGELARRSTLQ
jgi:hypothetical protein